MAEVITVVSARIDPERMPELEQAYRMLVSGGLGPSLEDTFLLQTESRVAILSVWRRRADLDAMLTSGEEPPARRLLRTHGGEPEPVFWDVVVHGRVAQD
jgi:hypothetical protein